MVLLVTFTVPTSLKMPPPRPLMSSPPVAELPLMVLLVTVTVPGR